jgi:hypothetical protein
MQRAFRPILGLLVIVGAIVASVLWFRDHETDGRSDYEKMVSEEPVAPSVSFACFPRRPTEGEIADLNENPESDDALVPGEPARLLLCRYWGLNYKGQSLRLAKRKLITDPAAVRPIADGLNDLPLFPDGDFACPADEGARTYARFAYPDDPQVVVELSSEGCPAATNGRSKTALFGDPVAHRILNFVPLPSAN